MGRVVRRSGRPDRGDDLGREVTPSASMRNPRPVRWDVLRVDDDDRSARVGFLEGVVEHLHHVEVREDDQEIVVTVHTGVDPDFSGGAVALVGLPSWTAIRFAAPCGERLIRDGAGEG